MLVWQRVLGSVRLLVEVLLIVASCEVAVMFVLPLLAPGVNEWQEAFLDATLLSVMAAPLLLWRAHRVARHFRARPSALEELFQRRGGAMPALVLVVGLGLTVSLAWGVREQAQRLARTRFDHVVSRVHGTVQERLAYAADGLRDIRSASALTGHPLGRSELHRWVTQQARSESSMASLSVIRPVLRSQVAAYEAQARASGLPDFAVRPAGQSPDLYIVDAIEPQGPNRKALGFDLGSEPTRREALLRAVDTGQPALTRRITLVQDPQKRPAFLYFLPIYQQDMPLDTVAHRRAALRGLVSSPVLAEDLFRGLDDAVRKQVTYELYGQAASGEPVYLAGSAGASQGRGRTMFETSVDLDISGQRLRLFVRSTPAFDVESSYAMPVWLGLLGALLSATAAAAVWLMNTGRARAEHLAQAMTQDLMGAKQAAEKASRESAALVSTLNRFGMVCVTSPEGKIIDVNEALCQTSGYSREELLGQNPRMLGAREHDGFFWIAAWQTLLHGQPWTGEVCNRTKDGALYWVQCVIAPITRSPGEVDKYISIAYDVTATHKAQEELQANAERFNLAIDGGSDGLWDWMNVHSQEEWWSPQFYRLLGYEPNELEANLDTFDEMLHPEDQRATVLAMERAFKDHQPFDVEYRLRTKSGAYRWFRARAKVYFDEFGAATRMAGSIQDVHERKEAQAKLREHSQQMSAIFSLSPDAFVSFDPNRCVSYISPAWAHLTGMSGHGLIGLDDEAFFARLFERAVPGQAAGSLQALMHMGQADQGQGQSPDARRVVIEMKPPARRMLEMRLSRSERGAVSQVLHLRDVTHETEVDQMKSAFLSMAAHELRTPMASIYGFTELLLTRHLKPDKQRDLLSRIYRQSEAIAAIINELLDLARIEARQGKDFSFGAHSLSDIVAGVIRDFKLPQDRQAPLTSFPDEEVLVWVDRQKMQQATLNVLSNAYKYSPGGGDVNVRLVERVVHGKPLAGIEIQDHGIGLTPDQLTRVGERFYRADKSGNIPGTGLGVTIVKEIMALMGGQISLSSEAGQGTTFTLWLPKLESSPSQFGELADLQPALHDDAPLS